MTRSLKCIGMTLLVLFFQAPARAYIMEGKEMLKLMVQHLGHPQSLLVHQKLLLYNRGPEEVPVELQETLRYQFPNRFRSETVSDLGQKIHVFSVDRSVTIIDKTITSTIENEVDHVTDVLLFNDPDMIWKRLTELGVDVSRTSLGRFERGIGYVIGAKYPDTAAQQLWIDKKTYRPWRLLIRAAQLEMRDIFWEFRYLDWREIDKTWYPHKIEVYRGGRLQQVFEVLRIQIGNSFPDALFDIQTLRSQYREMPSESMETGKPDELMDLRKSIQDFKSMYE